MRRISINEIIESLSCGEKTFCRLKGVEPKYDFYNRPRFVAGRGSVIFDVTMGGSRHALKCYTVPQELRGQLSDKLPTEEVPMVDFKLCDEFLPASDQIVRFRKGNTWGYAHLDGRRIVVERTLLSAREFAECRAVIGTTRGYGLIDTSGRLIMNDVWEQLEWYGDENIVTAANERGIWHIYDRQGRQLSAIGADWMGDASEGFVVARKGDKYGYYSTDGTKRCDCIYEEAFGFNAGRALVCFKGSYYHIDISLHRTSD